MHTHTYVVEGSFTFPIDMLRYDSSYPASEGESGRIQYAPEGRYAVSLTHACGGTARRCSWRPTAGRWESFGWRVLAAGEGV